jgi:hypothetical protein
MTEDGTGDNTTGLFTVIYYMDLAGGSLVINYILAVLFKEGLQLGPIWIGLPFFFAATLWLVVALVVFYVKDIPLEKTQSSSSSTVEDESLATSSTQVDTPQEIHNSSSSTSLLQGVLED